MGFTLMDARQVFSGAFVASLFFFVLRAGNPFTISVTAGIIITILVILMSNPRPRTKNLDVLATEIIVVYITVAILSIIFNLATIELVTFGLPGNFNYEVFGSPVIVAFWLALPVAVMFNKSNSDNFLSRVFVHKR